MTIKDIAREAGYAVGTVSRVLNDSPNVSPVARARIMDVVKRYNFQPNANAKHLKQQANSGIAIIVKGIQNILFADILEKIQDQIENRGYFSMLYYIDEEDNEVLQAEMVCQERKPYGIIFLGSNLEHFNSSVAKLGIPCILVTNNAITLDIPNLSSVSVDDVAGAALMIDHLCEMGHRKIGIIGGRPELSRPSLSRLAGCQSAMLRHGLSFDMNQQYAYARFSLKDGYRAMVDLLRKYPDITAVFAMSDLMALGAIRALHDNGLRVPDDLSVAGYDGITLARYCVPQLTTIHQNSERLAKRGVEILLHCIEDEVGAIHEMVPFKLLKGESVGAPRGEREGATVDLTCFPCTKPGVQVEV